MKTIDKLINDVNEMLKEANKTASICACGYDEGFYVGKGEAFEEILKLLQENNEINKNNENNEISMREENEITTIASSMVVNAKIIDGLNDEIRNPIDEIGEKFEKEGKQFNLSLINDKEITDTIDLVYKLCQEIDVQREQLFCKFNEQEITLQNLLNFDVSIIQCLDICFDLRTYNLNTFLANLLFRKAPFMFNCGYKVIDIIKKSATNSFDDEYLCVKVIISNDVNEYECFVDILIEEECKCPWIANEIIVKGIDKYLPSLCKEIFI